MPDHTTATDRPIAELFAAYERGEDLTADETAAVWAFARTVPSTPGNNVWD